MTTAQTNTLLYLANSCPYINAEAVFGARAILSATKDLEFDDASICSAIGIVFKMDEKDKIVEKDKEETPFEFIAKLFPNPTASYTTLYINRILNPRSRIIITDIVGKELLSDEFNDLKYNINTEIFNNGIYKISIVENDLIIYNTSMQILK